MRGARGIRLMKDAWIVRLRPRGRALALWTACALLVFAGLLWTHSRSSYIARWRKLSLVAGSPETRLPSASSFESRAGSSVPSEKLAPTTVGLAFALLSFLSSRKVLKAIKREANVA